MTGKSRLRGKPLCRTGRRRVLGRLQNKSTSFHSTQWRQAFDHLPYPTMVVFNIVQGRAKQDFDVVHQLLNNSEFCPTDLFKTLEARREGLGARLFPVGCNNNRIHSVQVVSLASLHGCTMSYEVLR